jgi:hypothetical protein
MGRLVKGGAGVGAVLTCEGWALLSPTRLSRPANALTGTASAA